MRWSLRLVAYLESTRGRNRPSAAVLRAGLVQRSDRFRVELQRRRAQDLRELIEIGRADDRRRDAGPRHEPGERDLRRLRMRSSPDRVERSENLHPTRIEEFLHAGSASAL